MMVIHCCGNLFTIVIKIALFYYRDSGKHGIECDLQSIFYASIEVNSLTFWELSKPDVTCNLR